MIKFDDLADKEINEIVFKYYLEKYKNHSQAIREYAQLNMRVATDPQVRLLRRGRTVFLLNFRDDEVEFHSMGKETSAFAFIRNIYQLIDFVRALPVKSISTYGSDPLFEKLYDRVLVDAKKDIQVGPDGMTYNLYRLEF